MPPAMNSFPDGFRALILGASGGIGSAFARQLQLIPGCAQIVKLHRRSEPEIDFDHEATIERAAVSLAAQAPFHLIINAIGVLHTPTYPPEKKLESLSYDQFLQSFRTNTFGPAMVIRHFSGLLDTQRGVMASLSAKVGSIEDNRLGGWYSYRASKAALNMLIKTAAIEIKRRQPSAVIVALHPGTVNSELSRPFDGARIGQDADAAAAKMLEVLDRLTPDETGQFFAYSGERLPW